MNKQEFWLRLLLVKGCRVKNLRRLRVRGELTEYQVEQQLNLAELKPEQQKMFFQCDETYLASVQEWLSHTDNHLVTYHDDDYPQLLRHIKDAPLALFVCGNVSLLNQPQIAMVGSRNFSHYGKQWGYYFAAELVKEGFTITSGLALGIDSICHRAAIENHGSTVAVLGSGLQSISPRTHISLANEIVDKQGVLVSEFFPTEPPLPEHFPRRNRIISGLCKGVLVVEAAIKSGSLITAKCALEQGREVFALPGPLGNNGYEGTHWLIQQGAYLVRQPSDIVEYLTNSFCWLDDITDDITDDISDGIEPDAVQQEVLPFSTLLSNVGDEVTPIDLIAERMACSPADIALELVELELSGHIASVSGGYVRIRKRITE